MAHGYWCNARTIPMTCRYCGEKVYFFSCDCGCKVFFDELGDPWPKHNCQEYLSTLQDNNITFYDDLLNTLKRLHDKHNSIKSQQQKTILVKNRGSWELIDEDDNNTILFEKEYEEVLKVNKRKKYSTEIPIIKIDNISNESIDILGVVVEIVHNINISKKFNIIGANIIASNLLKRFKDEKYDQLTIHSLNIGEKTKNSYTILVRSKDLMKIKKKDNIGVIISGNSLNNIKYWECNIIEKLEI
jgi:hypothetical protein